MEADDKVFVAPIPPGIYQTIEHFIVEHYVPDEPRKRKRKNWMDNR